MPTATSSILPADAAGQVPRSLTICGSTGSIGTQALDVIASAGRGRFRVEALAASGSRPQLLAEQVLEHGVLTVGVGSEQAAASLESAIGGLARSRGIAQPRVEIWAGPDAAARIAGLGSDVVLNAVAGGIGLGPTLAALEAGSTLALANKESLVVGGALVKQAVRRADQIVPVDSEHSAIAQCLRAGTRGEVARLILTASGGPFRGWDRAKLAGVTPQQALAHPTWAMGPLVTINSATMINKALELIEAQLLFDVPGSEIDVVVHPQSIVHSMVRFTDGSIIAQAAPPDMRGPIALALAWPQRLPGAIAPVDFSVAQAWQFEPPSPQAALAIDLARTALAASPLHPGVLNAANEVLVEAFLAGRIPFTAIIDGVSQVTNSFVPSTPPGSRLTLEDIADAQQWALQRAQTLVGRMANS